MQPFLRKFDDSAAADYPMLEATPAWLEKLWAGECLYTALRATQPLPNPTTPQALFPGSFNPLHLGHLQIAQLAAQRLGTAVAFELAMLNVDKPPLAPPDLLARLTQFPPASTIFITRSPTFLEKARLFPQTTFIVGVDTILRFAQSDYHGSPSQHRAAIEEFTQLKGRFLVFGRLHQGRFLTLGDLSLPAEVANLCTGLTESEFRIDLASRDLRSPPPASG